ncbi:hypothetical protein [Marinomonas aquiplantarum]|uniref:DUF1127 domain-containing protein n=1 Tax=Marinomonas aquiplantarum TaxID=491951 RepID=A0A366D857_9GAMM|nr:hypothetical protein [Marinomonas aquiplantarum]RBO86220.1 hypothetical protein DFP76_101497 [Marinomonas aquiplantarum]
MWALLLWLNQKILNLNNKLKAKKEERKRREELREVHLESRNLPEYLRKDLGLPPYDSYDKRDHL